MSPQELIKEALMKGVKRLVLTDINNTSELLRTISLGQKQGVQIFPGIDFRNGSQQEFVGIAINNEGFYELNAYLSKYDGRQKKIPSMAPDFKHVYVIYPWLKRDVVKLKSREFLGLRPSELNQLTFSKWKQSKGKLLALCPATFRGKRDWNIHRLLRAIDTKKLLTALPASELAHDADLLLEVNTIREKYKDNPELVTNAEKLLSTIDFRFDFEQRQHNNQRSYTSNPDLDFRLLKKLCYDGLSYRYANPESYIYRRIEKELEVIRQKEFVSYFLIAWKLLKYARSKGYFYVGRGSGANSILSYLLRITDVDPIELDLYFERFINLFRNSPPDFDIDFSWKDREDVTRYIFKRFPNVCLLGAYSTFKGKSVVRELGKVFGLPDDEIKRLQSTKRADDELGALILKYSKLIYGLPSHLTVHSAGILISEKPIYHYSATFMPPKGFRTVHFDMHVAEDIGLYKFDILGQRGLAKVKEALALVKENRGVDLDIHNIGKLKKDVQANGLLSTSHAIGCFYVESPAMRMLLKKLKVDNYLALVAASSVIRPGVAQSGMMREYILRHRDKKRREWARDYCPELYDLMPETYGVMVYQEDVIKVAHYFAGLSLAEADVLRRGMSGKFRGRPEFQVVRDKFFENCAAKGISEPIVKNVWTQIESFAGYAFAKGHSASYAVESYQCLYLKAYYPIEFMVANINNGGGFYSREIYVHEARKYGARVHTPCLNNSEHRTCLKGIDMYLGLSMIYGLDQITMNLILWERKEQGMFLGLRDFISRVPVSLEQLIILIRSACFSFTGKEKKELLWDAHYLLKREAKIKPDESLFETEVKEFKLPKLWKHTLEDVFDEIAFIGFAISKSPFELLKALPDYGLKAAQLSYFPNQMVKILAYLVHVKNISTQGGKHMCFATFLDLEGEWLDVVMFPNELKRFPFVGPGCYLLYGKVVEEFGYYSLQLKWHKRLANRSLDDAPSSGLKAS